MLNVAGDVFIQHEKEIYDSNQKINTFEKHIGDVKTKKDVLNKVFESKKKKT